MPGMKSGGEAINHFNAVRIRLNGSGNLNIIAYGLDEQNAQTLQQFTMQSATSVQPTKLMNMREQRMSLEINVTEINEWFEIHRIVVFSKPIFTSVPG